MDILISRGNNQTTKSYPFWDELILLLKDHEIKEIRGILSKQELIDLCKCAHIVITIDSFLPHLIKCYKLEPKVICIWGKSDPLLFGYTDNVNLLKDRKYLRRMQFRDWVSPWNDIENIKEMWVTPEIVLKAIEDMV